MKTRTMKSKMAVLISLILFFSCNNLNKTKERTILVNDVLNVENTSKGYNSTESEIIKRTSRKNQDEELNKSPNCIFQDEKYFIPQIRQSIGDTINIQKTYDWIQHLEISKEDNDIRKLINREGKFFQISERESFITIGLLEDEGEYIGINIYLIDKETCEILGMELLAETTAWENGYKETYSVFENDFSIRREKRTGSRDWGDYTKWARDTIITMMIFDDGREIILKEK